MKILMSFICSILLAGTLARADAPSTHGMLVFGHEAGTYASHLPMFHAPHHWQVILKITLKGVPGSGALAAYAEAQSTGKTLFTLEPELMDLTKIVNGTKVEFNAAIYDGHFERGGRNLGNLKVRIEKIVFSSKLNGETPPQQREKYLVFGEKGEYFAAHLIQGKPSFDVIAEVSQPYELHVRYCRTRMCPEPTKTQVTDENLPLNLVGPGEAQAFQTDPAPGEIGAIQLGGLFDDAVTDVKSVLYVEEGDLSH